MACNRAQALKQKRHGPLKRNRTVQGAWAAAAAVHGALIVCPAEWHTAGWPSNAPLQHTGSGQAAPRFT